jgi:hypothetical protein
MGGFATPLQAEWSEDGRHVTLTAPLAYVDDGGTFYMVPSAFRSDGASIPNPCWPLVGSPLQGRHVRSSILHDYLYAAQFPRREADGVFYRAMRSDGVGVVRARLIHAAVRTFGWLPYRRRK